MAPPKFSTRGSVSANACPARYSEPRAASSTDSVLSQPAISARFSSFFVVAASASQSSANSRKLPTTVSNIDAVRWRCSRSRHGRFKSHRSTEFLNIERRDITCHFSILMSSVCPSCQSAIPIEDINVLTDLPLPSLRQDFSPRFTSRNSLEFPRPMVRHQLTATWSLVQTVSSTFASVLLRPIREQCSLSRVTCVWAKGFASKQHLWNSRLKIGTISIPSYLSFLGAIRIPDSL